jgi:Dolichyl-phosphate-mannose-protein mannosyltransferase
MTSRKTRGHFFARVYFRASWLVLTAALGRAWPDNACMRLQIPRPCLESAVYWIAGVACFLRLAARLLQGIDSFWVNGYALFFELAQSIAAGKGMALASGAPTAFRVPLYPILLAGLTLGHRWFWPIAIAQSLIGAATVVCAAFLARQIFAGLQGRMAAIVAALITAIYPYYVVHDTALQETSLYTLLTLIAVVLVLRAACAARTSTLGPAALCGLVLGLDVLTRSPMALFALIVPLWLAARRRFANGAICAGLLLITVLPWLWRNERLFGVPVLTTEAGYGLWNGNNDMLFRYYPMQSVDVSIDAHVDALDAMTTRETTTAAELPPVTANEAVIDRWFERQALDYMRAHPWLTFVNGFRKIGATFDWLPTPRRSRTQTVLHFVSFGPVMLLGLWGMWLRRAHWRDDSLVYSLFGQFLLVTAVYFGQTNHRVFLDVYFIVFGAGALAEKFTKTATNDRVFPP